MSKFKQQFLAGPYLIWIIGFIILPMVMILYYAFTNSNGSFTVEYIAAIATETNRKAIFLSLKLGVICTLVCLVLSYPLAMILKKIVTLLAPRSRAASIQSLRIRVSEL